jgi:hypothetical protein
MRINHWNGHCQRCGKKSASWTMSMFNMQLICGDCDEKEMKHPDYKKAVDAELQATKDGNKSFRGIGLPDDLRGHAEKRKEAG